jgi:hypothetical protein
MSIQAIRALGAFVFDGIEQRLMIGSPGDTRNSLEAPGKRFAGAKILQVKRVLTESGRIG